jgi:hypothetical protein
LGIGKDRRSWAPRFDKEVDQAVEAEARDGEADYGKDGYR